MNDYQQKIASMVERLRTAIAAFDELHSRSSSEIRRDAAIAVLSPPLVLEPSTGAILGSLMAHEREWQEKIRAAHRELEEARDTLASEMRLLWNLPGTFSLPGLRSLSVRSR